MSKFKKWAEVIQVPLNKVKEVNPKTALKGVVMFCLGVGTSYLLMSTQKSSEVAERTPAAHIPADEPLLTPISVKPIDIKNIENHFTSYVTLKPWKQVKILPKSNMTVQELLVSWGDPVRKGQSLAILYSEVYQLKKQLERLEYNLKLKEFENVSKLAKKNFISRNEFNQKKMELKKQRIRKRISELQSSSIKMVAPIDGIVSVIKMKQGDFIDRPGQYYIEVIDTQAFKVELNLPQSVSSLIGLGEEVVLSRLGDKKGDSSSPIGYGEIAAISPIVDPKSGAVYTEVEIRDAPESWKTGMFVEAKFVTAKAQEALVVPNQSIVYKNDKPVVYRLVASEEGETVEVIPDLEVGITDGVHTVVKGSLSQADEVVVEGQGGLKNKAKVRVVN